MEEVGIGETPVGHEWRGISQIMSAGGLRATQQRHQPDRWRLSCIDAEEDRAGLC